MNNTFNAEHNIPFALFANEFALNGKVDFKNAREWIIFLYLVAQLDPKKEDHFPERFIPITQLKTMLQKKGKRSGSLYSDIKKASRRMAKVVCEFDSNVYINEKALPIYIPIFQKISAKQTQEGIYISYKFNEEMKPLLLGFKQHFFGIHPPNEMTSAHAIRFLLYAKAQRDRNRKRDGKVSTITIEVDGLKSLLKLDGQYPRFNNFKTRVIEPIIKGINQSGVLNIIQTDYEKQGKTVTNLIFHITDSLTDAKTDAQTKAKVNPKVTSKANSKSISKETTTKSQNSSIPNESIQTEELDQLSHAQLKAFHFLVEKGIYEGIAVRKILHRMPSSVCEGYEDYFCQEVYKIVAEKSIASDDKGRAAVLVDWFMKDIFNHHYFSRIVEAVHDRKKQLTQEQRDNRTMAKGMSDQAFRIAYQKRVAGEMPHCAG